MDATTLRINAMASGLASGVLGWAGHGAELVVQGCHIGCRDCVSPHTHSSRAGRVVSVADLMQWLQGLHQCGQLERLTLTGGEVSEQAVAVQALLAQFVKAFPQVEVVMYSGLTWRALQRRFSALVAPCDVVVAGPYVAHRAATALAGSNNQTVHLLTTRARERYRHWRQWPLHRVQLLPAQGEAGPQRVLLVGIPSRPLAARLMSAPRAAGA